VVFVAPTKPLVAQQIDACHQTCGIPGSDAAELTGQVPRAMRGRAVSYIGKHLKRSSLLLDTVERKTRVLHDPANAHQ
jgi:hypothetical protein